MSRSCVIRQNTTMIQLGTRMSHTLALAGQSVQLLLLPNMCCLHPSGWLLLDAGCDLAAALLEL